METVWRPKCLENFKEHLPFGILEWEVEERTASANFLDLTISINKYRKINTRGWLEEYHEELPTDFPTKAVKEALKLVMHHRFIEFGDFFLAIK